MIIEVTEKNSKQDIIQAWHEYRDSVDLTIERLKMQRMQILIGCAVVLTLYILWWTKK